ncbi:MAG: RNA 2',3'-cyclic phosphodiesterase [Chloroflexota bacterium]
MEPIRAFIAIELPDQVKENLRRLQGQLRQAGGPDGIGVRWVNPDGIHLTLKFLGNVAADKIPAVTQAMNQAAEGTGALALATTGLGAFPNWRRVRVLWVGLEGDLERLQALQKRLEQGLKPLGFPPEGRSFSPHLTLGRMREHMAPEEIRRFEEAISALGVESTQPWVADSLNLMRSELRPSGAVYSRMASARL